MVYEFVYNPYIPVIILSIIAFYVIGSAGIGWLPLIGEIEDAERVNAVLLNLSYSFLASVMFFLMMDVIPRWRNEQKAEKVFNEQLKDVMRYMNRIIAVLKMMSGTDKSDDELEPKDFSSLTSLPSSLHCAYVEYTVGDSKVKEQGAIDCYAYLNYYSKKIRDRLEHILELPLSAMMRQELMTLLVEIKVSEVLKICSGSFKSVSLTKSDIYLYNLCNHVSPFLSLYKRLEKYVEPQRKYQFNYVDVESREELHNKLNSLTNVLKVGKVTIDNVSEIHYNHTFLCLYALPEQYHIVEK